MLCECTLYGPASADCYQDSGRGRNPPPWGEDELCEVLRNIDLSKHVQWNSEAQAAQAVEAWGGPKPYGLGEGALCGALGFGGGGVGDESLNM